MKFKVVHGFIRIGKAEYKKGDVFDSSLMLHKAFPDKVAKVGESAAVATSEPAPQPSIPPPAPVEQKAPEPPPPAAPAPAPAADDTKRVEVEEEEKKQEIYRAEHRGAGHWDVVNALTGEKVNKRSLNKTKAMEFASKLNQAT